MAELKEKPKRDVPSRQWSCSELKDGHKQLMNVKMEAVSKDQLAKEIKEYEQKIAMLKQAASEQSVAEAETQAASPEEVAKAQSKTRAAKSKAKAKAGKQVPLEPEGVPEKHGRSPVKPDQPSPNPHAPKRVRGKQPEQPVAPEEKNQSQMIKELLEANKKMVEEMEKLKAANQSSSSKNPYKTPPPKISAPTPEKPPVAPPVEVAPPVTEAARLARLRRLCEKKPSGKCSVPEAVHLQWKNASKVEREHMIDELEKAGWSKELFVSRITKVLTKTNKLSKRKKRGWFTKDAMSKVLGWSGPYIKNVVEYCEKRGNAEKLTKKDRYDKKLKKYYVVYEENDEEVSEDEERKEQHDAEVAEDNISFQRLGATRVDSDGEDDESDKEKDAKQVNTGLEEYEKFARFTDSLLSRSSKLTDLSQQLENGLVEAGKDCESSEGKRVSKLVQNLDAATETLEAEYEKRDKVKLDVSSLRSNKGLPESTVTELRKKIDAQVRLTTGACSRVTTAEVAAKNLLKILRK